jgi:hypothetical protein
MGWAHGPADTWVCFVSGSVRWELSIGVWWLSKRFNTAQRLGQRTRVVQDQSGMLPDQIDMKYPECTDELVPMKLSKRFAPRESAAVRSR